MNQNSEAMTEGRAVRHVSVEWDGSSDLVRICVEPDRTDQPRNLSGWLVLDIRFLKGVKQTFPPRAIIALFGAAWCVKSCSRTTRRGRRQLAQGDLRADSRCASQSDVRDQSGHQGFGCAAAQLQS